MLIDISFTDEFLTLMIGGQEVGQIAVDGYNQLFPESPENDWIGFYAYADVPIVELDCVAIYPYVVPSVLAKRRWVYGQAVENFENLNASYNGLSALIDYSFAKYANNYMYPDMGKWDRGIVENLRVENNTILSPNYSKPLAVFRNQDESAWLSDLAALFESENPYIILNPGEDWNEEGGHLFFEKMNFLNQNLATLFGLFECDPGYREEQILFEIVEENTLNYFRISVIEDRVEYRLKYGRSEEELVYTSFGHYYGNKFLVGFDIAPFSAKFGGKLLAFFGNIRNLRLYVGGNANFEKSFRGTIYQIGFSTDWNRSKVEYLFNEFGIPNQYENVFSLYEIEPSIDSGNIAEETTDLLDGGNPGSFEITNIQEFSSSYTVFARKSFGEVVLDANADGYWEDYIPLKYFAKNVNNSSGRKEYTLDFIQFNIDYPSIAQRDGEYLNTESSDIRFFTNFQFVSSGPNLLNSSFGSVVRPSIDRVLRPDPHWFNTRYEILDDYIIYPPTNVPIDDLAIAINMEFSMKNILTRTSRIRSMQLASQALDSIAPNEIKTRYGKSLFPYTKSGIYFDYKKPNPFSIYKGSTPYLYLTKDSGIRLRGDSDTYKNRGIAMLINEELADNYQMVAMQSSIFFDKNDVSAGAQAIFSIESAEEEITISAISAHPENKRILLFATDKKTGRPSKNFRFYINGNLSYNPVISTDQWNVVGIAFANKLVFDSITGRLNLVGKALVNNISYYTSSGIEQAEAGISKQWIRVQQNEEESIEWDTWIDLLWEELLLAEETIFYGANPSNIYKSFVGADKIVVGDDKPIEFKNYSYNIYQNASRSVTTYEPL